MSDFDVEACLSCMCNVFYNPDSCQCECHLELDEDEGA